MLEVIINIIGCLIMVITEFFVIKRIIKSEEKILNLKNAIIVLLLAIVTSIPYSTTYRSIYTILTFALSIIAFKYIFKQSIADTIIATAMFMIFTFFTDMINTILYLSFISIKVLRKEACIRLLANITFGIISISLINVPIIKEKANAIYKKIKSIRYNSTIIFLILMIIAFTILAYNFCAKNNWNIEYIINVLVVFIFYILLIIFFSEKNATSKVTAEYDNLFNYVQNFENWIEKEQLNRHEYKNQLAVLRDITKEKKTKRKIDEILEDNINIDGETINQLKALPKGGIKGLMYYKLVIAQKNKINITINVSIKKKSILNKLSENKVKDLCKLIGIYFDNAIEAASETRKKNILIEMYELKDKVNIVFSNTFNRTKSFDKRNEKGITSKGKGRGNGLYFAKKIISKNKWLDEKQEVVDKYYIQKISILKLEK